MEVRTDPRMFQVEQSNGVFAKPALDQLKCAMITAAEMFHVEHF